MDGGRPPQPERGALVALPKKLADRGDVLSYSVKFVVITSGTASPSWKLVNLSAGAPLFSANRTRTQELLLTLGPTDTTPQGKKVPAQAAQGVHLSGEIYSAVANGFRAATQ